MPFHQRSHSGRPELVIGHLRTSPSAPAQVTPTKSELAGTERRLATRHPRTGAAWLPSGRHIATRCRATRWEHMGKKDRRRSFTTKLTAAEHQEVLALSGGAPITSQWLRAFLLERARRRSTEEIVIGELLAVRAVVLNTLVAIAPQADVRSIVTHADAGKSDKARRALGLSS